MALYVVVELALFEQGKIYPCTRHLLFSHHQITLMAALEKLIFNFNIARNVTIETRGPTEKSVASGAVVNPLERFLW